ncbi:MAG: DUF3418 domain-containing protein [Polyangiaceae bacterium]|nr:DUF3418 domain-containing protein [Polyangiaceae bacterium]
MVIDVLLAVRGVVANIAAKLPAALPRSDGMIVSRAETEAFRALLLARTPRLTPIAKTFGGAITATTEELQKTLLALKNAAKHPSGTVASREIRLQLQGMFAAAVLETVPLVRLAHLPRYLRTIQAPRAGQRG